MKYRPQLRTSLLAAALAATAASAWAAYEIGNSTLVPAPSNEAEAQAAAMQPAPLAAEPAIVANEQALAPNEQIVTPAPAAAPRQTLAPVSEAHPAPAITVETPRLTVDQRIQADVMDLLARAPNITGKIGVVSEDSVVTLTGWTTTSGMAWRAGRDARGVAGVRHVVNEIRPRVGGISS
jgi:hypothetical protein